jgi:hypothetical protein
VVASGVWWRSGGVRGSGGGVVASGGVVEILSGIRGIAGVSEELMQVL